MDEYIKCQNELADKYDRQWWDKSGKRIFDFLIEEANVYRKEHN